MEALSHMSLGSLHIQTCTCNGTAIMPSVPNISVIGTLHHRANTICSSPELLQQEEHHLKKVLTKYKYPCLGSQQDKNENTSPKNQQKNKSCMTSNQKQNLYIVVPYYKGLSESLKENLPKIWSASILQRR